MSEWITDRRPTLEDCQNKELREYVWVDTFGKVESCPYGHVVLGCPWQPIVITKPEPYVSPKSKYSAVLYYACDSEPWVVSDGMNHVAENIPTREAAERIAAIYNEVMP